MRGSPQNVCGETTAPALKAAVSCGSSAHLRKGLEMQAEVRKYLLDITALLEDEERTSLLAEAFSKVDESRREKAGRMKQERSRAASLGAGLLLQLAVQRAESERASGEIPALRAVARYTVSGLLKELDRPISLMYRYGENGKPYLKNYPYYFNLSHSGSYAVCVLSGREVGADIQIHRTADFGRLVKRFFSPAEAEAFAGAEEPEKLFFRLWARKEAFGKLTGRGIADALGKDFCTQGTEPCRGLVWEECDEPAGYSIAVCREYENRMG